MAETTVNESTEQRRGADKGLEAVISTNSGAELVISGLSTVASFAVMKAGNIASLLAVINESNADTLFIDGAIDAVSDMAWELQQAVGILSSHLEAQAIRDR